MHKNAADFGLPCAALCSMVCISMDCFQHSLTFSDVLRAYCSAVLPADMHIKCWAAEHTVLLTTP